MSRNEHEKAWAPPDAGVSKTIFSRVNSLTQSNFVVVVVFSCSKERFSTDQRFSKRFGDVIHLLPLSLVIVAV